MTPTIRGRNWWAIHLGFLLSDRVEVEPFQGHRDRKTWKWPPKTQADLYLTASGLPEFEVTNPLEAVLRVSLSAPVGPDDTILHATADFIEVEIGVVTPSVTWLCSKEQVTTIGQTLRDVLGVLRATAPRIRRLHFLYAGPTPDPIVIGQAIGG